MCLGNISKYFRINNMIKVELKGSVKFFRVSNNDILPIHKYLMKRK